MRIEYKNKAPTASGCCHRMTLIEILIATFILVIGLVGIMSLVPVAIRQAGAALRSSRAASVAQNAKVSIMRERLNLYDSNSDFSLSGAYIWGDPLPDDSAFWTDEFGDYIFETADEEGNDVFFVLDDPGPDRSPYAWQAEFEPINGNYRVELTVFYPRPYADREVYRTSFVMRQP